MKTIGGAIFLSVLLIALASCTTFASQPTETPMLTKTSLPTETPSASLLPMPAEKPLSEWEGVPIMPTATEGNGDSQSYSFMVNDLVDNVNTFYQEEMVKFGWRLSRGKGNEMQSFMSFTKDGDTVDVTVVLQSDGLTYVTLEKQVQSR